MLKKDHGHLLRRVAKSCDAAKSAIRAAVGHPFVHQKGFIGSSSAPSAWGCHHDKAQRDAALVADLDALEGTVFGLIHGTPPAQKFIFRSMLNRHQPLRQSELGGIRSLGALT